MKKVWLALAVLFAISGFVNAHQAPSGWQYDGACCGNADCMPIEEAIQKDGKWYYRTKLGTYPIDNRTMIKQSGDGLTHSCVFSGRLWCIYLPPGN